MIDVVNRINELRKARGWSVYRLSQECGLSATTIHKWFEQKSYPNLPAIETVCEAFGITLPEFFSEGKLVEITPENKVLYTSWGCLTREEKTLITKLIDVCVKNHKSKN